MYALAWHVDVFVHRHHFDEAHGDRAVARQLGERGDLVVVLAAHHDAVEFDRPEAGGERGIDAGEHALEPGPARDRLEAILAQRVERDVGARQAGVAQAFDLVGQQQAVGRERDVVDARDRGDHRDQAVQIAADQRLAAGEPDAAHADLGRRAHDLGDLLVAEDLGACRSTAAPLRACSRRSAGCSGPSPRCAGR